MTGHKGSPVVTGPPLCDRAYLRYSVPQDECRCRGRGQYRRPCIIPELFVYNSLIDPPLHPPRVVSGLEILKGDRITSPSLFLVSLEVDVPRAPDYRFDDVES